MFGVVGLGEVYLFLLWKVILMVVLCVLGMGVKCYWWMVLMVVVVRWVWLDLVVWVCVIVLFGVMMNCICVKLLWKFWVCNWCGMMGLILIRSLSGVLVFLVGGGGGCIVCVVVVSGVVGWGRGGVEVSIIGVCLGLGLEVVVVMVGVGVGVGLCNVGVGVVVLICICMGVGVGVGVFLEVVVMGVGLCGVGGGVGCGVLLVLILI